MTSWDRSGGARLSASSSDDDRDHGPPPRKRPHGGGDRYSRAELRHDPDNDGPPRKRPHSSGEGFSRAGPHGGSLSDSFSDEVHEEDRTPDPTPNHLQPSDFIVKHDAQKDEPTYSNAAAKMMAKMGYKKGTGLGRHGQGRKEIVAASMQKGRRGLGMVVPMFQPSDVIWKFELEEVSAHETVDWLPVCDLPVPDLAELKTWMEEGPEKLEISDETNFCSQQTLTTVLNCKSVFDVLEGEQMRRARTRSNPYETIKGVFFQNRAAMKMANMDAVLDFMFTSPVSPSGEPMIKADELEYFADICAGPGGFTEYVLWRKKWDSKGFGFTLKGDCDFKLHEFTAASSEYFEPHYGVDVLNGDGDIYRPDNQKAFQEFVLNSTDGKGVHFVMADGGFSVEGSENIQEILSKRLYLCQCLVALSVLREGGHYVCKLFDIFTPFSVGLVYLMNRAFQQVSIYKPVTSRPANSERYIVCKWVRADAGPILEYLREINEVIEHHSRRRTGQDVQHVVPLSILQDDDAFFEYIVTSNEMLGKKQAIALSKIQTFAQNNSLYENRQSQIRAECLQIWKIPDDVRKNRNKYVRPDEKFRQLFKENDESYLNAPPEALTLHNLSSTMHSVYDYRCFISGAEEQWMLLSLGRSNVFKWNGKPNSHWRKVADLRVEIPDDTLMQVEFVMEFQGEGSSQRREMAIHIIDAFVLGGVDIRSLHFIPRMEKIKRFVRAITRPTRTDLAPVRVKDVFKCENIDELFQQDRLAMRRMKGSARISRLCFLCNSYQYYVPSGIHFIKTVRDPWMMAMSSKGMKYFYNTMSRVSTHAIPEDSVADVRACMEKRLVWKWEDGVKVHPAQESTNPNLLSADAIRDFVLKHTKRK